jgi:hypothetical protein
MDESRFFDIMRIANDRASTWKAKPWLDVNEHKQVPLDQCRLLTSCRTKIMGTTVCMTNIQQAIVALIWNIIEFITICINRKGIHPGAHIGLDILLSAALLSTGGISFYIIALVGGSSVLGRYTTAAVFITLAG